ncbi:hypothetical protein LOZ53_006022 [Ophidiomyces ophidiicola]|uniref:uncharacterized protein n=1 Tax=Ophidiomyces ophidiicola TaxID=1387563 RepID=UPI0020C36A6D|nr:uncharacterized protein LOZ57_004883 [Ophidiomyces ophidiicola]KAI1912150.1 hypothetical protein LOZ61_003500 [Ophidiomyces ophidiicola]KAI1921857.1 hypothetical protein LOZ60_006028 [Ophidiomyces ophidiicola]KAI1944207.1 hypothetical protein LOZ57_004883 [Ophidiomyces ophidiicola]KAI1959724.1 hypothetical protein LOZ59_002975 [Ophidiomyces ophidiicola]KAI1970571.1 hypothetical protein LOZ55_006490 [Ophidiomyces ophidiicola]
MACPITVAKFVGTISLGLLTGVSYSASTITIPALHLLPTANDAAQTFKDIQVRTRRRVFTLSNLTAISLLTAFSLSSPRRKHPYLVWTGLIALIGGTGLECWANRKSMSWVEPFTASICCVGSNSSESSLCNLGFGSWAATHLGCRRQPTPHDRRLEEEESNGNGSEIEIVNEFDAIPTPSTREQSASPDDLVVDVNGETVRDSMARERKIQKMRTWILGVAFSMAVVGIWGDGA